MMAGVNCACLVPNVCQLTSWGLAPNLVLSKGGLLLPIPAVTKLIFCACLRTAGPDFMRPCPLGFVFDLEACAIDVDGVRETMVPLFTADGTLAQRHACPQLFVVDSHKLSIGA
jgi:hypothetical protein